MTTTNETDNVLQLPRRQHVSHGRPRKERGHDLFDTPPGALFPLFAHEPLLAGVTCFAEYFCGRGNLVLPLRARGFKVYASDLLSRGCPNSSVCDFFTITERPDDCHVALSNPPFIHAMAAIERSFELGFDLVIFLLKLGFLCTADRLDRLHRPGHLRRVHILAERLQGMHDEAHLAAGGAKAGQSQTHAWFVFDRHYVGPATLNPISLNDPTARMPWITT